VAPDGAPVVLTSQGALRIAEQRLRPSTLDVPPSRPSRVLETAGYPPTYYPSAVDEASADILEVAAGEAVEDADIQLRLALPVELRGKVLRGDGTPAPRATVWVWRSSGAKSSAGLVMAQPNRKAEYAVTLPLPGTYRILVRGTDDPRGDVAVTSGQTAWALDERTFDVGTVEHVSTLAGGAVVSGTVNALDHTVELDWHGHVELVPADVLLPPVPAPAATVDPGGHFAFENVPPGFYLIRVTNLRRGGRPYFIEQAHVSGREIADSGVVLRAAEHVECRLTASPSLASVAGRVQAATGGAQFVAIFSADSSHWTPHSRRIRTPLLSQDGEFLVTELPAGTYLVAALRGTDPQVVKDVRFLERLAPFAVRLVVRAGQQIRLELKTPVG
jgi:hypothetical protein